jgi:hypothetical protein
MMDMNGQFFTCCPHQHLYRLVRASIDPGGPYRSRGGALSEMSIDNSSSSSRVVLIFDQHNQHTHTQVPPLISSFILNSFSAGRFKAGVRCSVDGRKCSMAARPHVLVGVKSTLKRKGRTSRDSRPCLVLPLDYPHEYLNVRGYNASSLLSYHSGTDLYENSFDVPIDTVSLESSAVRFHFPAHC